MPSFAIGSALVVQGHLGKGRKLLEEAMPCYLWGTSPTPSAEGERALGIGEMLNASGVIAMAHLILSGRSIYEDQGPESQQRSDEHAKTAIEVSVKAGDVVFQYMDQFAARRADIALCESKGIEKRAAQVRALMQG